MKIVEHALVALLLGYRYLVSPAKGVLLGSVASCRFEPTCSAYALEAIRRHGPLAGTRLAVRRICRCHPWGGFGLDPVPSPTAAARTHRPACLPAAPSPLPHGS